MKSGKTCSPSRRKPGESLFVRIEANLTGQQNFVVKYSGRFRPSDNGGRGRVSQKKKLFFGPQFGLKMSYEGEGGGAAHPGPSSGSATEIDLLRLYVLFSKCGPHNIFKGIYPFLYLYVMYICTCG